VREDVPLRNLWVLVPTSKSLMCWRSWDWPLERSLIGLPEFDPTGERATSGRYLPYIHNRGDVLPGSDINSLSSILSALLSLTLRAASYLGKTSCSREWLLSPSAVIALGSLAMNGFSLGWIYREGALPLVSERKWIPLSQQMIHKNVGGKGCTLGHLLNR
jgi:hypothetical protein